MPTSGIVSHPNRVRPVARALVRAALLSTAALAGLIIAVSPSAVAAASGDGMPAVAIDHIADNAYTIGTTGQLVRVDPRSTPLSAPLFNLDGNPLHLTWGQYSSASAMSLTEVVTTTGKSATDIQIALTGLVPNGVYSLFYYTLSPNTANPVCPTTDIEVALTARHPQQQLPDASSFVADGSGGASFHALVAESLFDAGQAFVSVIYHFDGHVYGPVPNQGEAQSNCRSSFGIDAFRQFLIALK